jgi:hypothetical protein
MSTHLHSCVLLLTRVARMAAATCRKQPNQAAGSGCGAVAWWWPCGQTHVACARGMRRGLCLQLACRCACWCRGGSRLAWQHSLSACLDLWMQHPHLDATSTLVWSSAHSRQVASLCIWERTDELMCSTPAAELRLWGWWSGGGRLSGAIAGPLSVQRTLLCQPLCLLHVHPAS